MTRPRGTFRSLSNRNYRLYFIGQTISVTGTWMQKLGQAWLVLELTGSGTLLGVTVALQHLPTLVVGPWGGLLADRVSKRKILLWTQAMAGVQALLLGALTAIDRVEWWTVLLLAFGLGMTDAIDRPARNTFVVEMVGAAHLTNAIMLINIVMNFGKLGGPAISGFVISTLGLASSFILNSVSYFALIVVLLLMRVNELTPAVFVHRSRGQLRDGMRYVWRTPELLGVLALMTASGMLAYEWNVTLPLIARETFNGDAQTLAIMFSALGLGAIVGGLLVASTLKASITAVITTALVFSLLVLAAAVSPTMPIALVSLFGVGAASIAFKSVAMSLVQLRSAPEMRGRVTSLLIVALFGTTSIGAPLVGWASQTFSPRIAVAQGGIVTAVAAISIYFFLKHTGMRQQATHSDGAKACTTSQNSAK